MRSGGVVAAAAGAVDAAGAAVGGAAWAAGALLAGADDAPPVQASSARESTTSATGATRPARGPRGNSAIFRLRGPTSSALLKPGRSCTGYGTPWASIGNAGGRRYPLRGGRRTPDEENEKPEVSTRYLGLLSGSGGRIRTGDLRVMSPTSYHCSTPRRGGGTDLLSQRRAASIVGAGAFHDRVREGNGWDHPAHGTAPGTGSGPGCSVWKRARSGGWHARAREQARRPRPLVPLRCDRCRPYTGGLSTRSSPWGLTPCGWETSSCGGLRTYMRSALIP